MSTNQIIKNQEEKTSVKKGGPYTEKQRLQRQNKVYRMHFEQGYSAVKIADELGVSRNTINSDIQNCYKEMVEEFPKEEISFLFLNQIQSLRFQKARLLQYLPDKTMENKKLELERLISTIDCKIAHFVLNLNSGGRPRSNLFKKSENKTY